MRSTTRLSALRYVCAIFIMACTFKSYGKQIPTVTGILKSDFGASAPVTLGNTSAVSTILVPVVAGTQDYDVQNMVSLKYDLNTDTFFLSPAHVRIKVKIERWDASNSVMTTISRKLSINVNNKFNDPILEQSSVNLISGYKVKVTIDSIWVNGIPVQTLPRYVSVESEINMDRYYDFSSSSNTDAVPTSLTALDNDCDGIDDEVLITWSAPSAMPEEYQLEWTYTNNYSASGGAYPASAFKADFKGNSTRITTYDNSYKVSLLFDKGYLAFRVRAVGRDYMNPTVFMYGPWSANDGVTLSSLSSDELYSVTQEHEKIKNWQYSSTYAEEGKKKEVVSYFDGSLHNRQTVTKINSDNNVIVGETMYDHQGRPAVNVLPAPVVNNCVTTGSEPSIKYYTKFNVDSVGNVYSKKNFDLDLNGTCNPLPGKMDTISGASQYYSNNNPDQSKQQSFLPHAKKYPFTQIEYTPDNTGRIRNQSGVGKDYQLGTGKETKYLYGQPNQIQVDRLFGSEAGDASHYKKNVIIDANGQSSVTYQNQEGKTIATALAGIPPTLAPSTNTRLDSLSYAAGGQSLRDIDLFMKDANGKSLVNKIPPSSDQVSFSTQLLVAFRSQYDFKYELIVDTLGDPCLRNDICISCVYDLEIEIRDECGVNLVPAVTPFQPIKRVTGKVDTTGGVLTFNIHCTNPNLFKDSAKVSLTLDPGVYTVSKVLKINQEAKDFYVKNYLDSVNNSCVKTLKQFQAAELAKIDTSDCYNTCASCAAALGAKDDYISSGKGTAAQWDFLREQCLSPCRQKTLCDVTYDMMLSDVSPGGQYGKFDATTYSATSELLSVYNTSNGLNPNIIPGMQAHWQKPLLKLNGIFYNLYLDENGNRSKVYVTQVSPGVYQPAVNDPLLIFVDVSNGLNYTYPENLQKLADFIQRWNPGFARSLVTLHPEYAYYVSCSEQAVKFPGDNRSSDSFDSLLLASQNFSQAFANGFIKSNYNTPTAAINKIQDVWLTASGNYDPFFTNSNFQYSTGVNPTTRTKTNIVMAGGNIYNVNLQTEMDYIINHYRFIGSTPYTMADIAAVVTRCGNNFGSAPTAACLAFGQDFYPMTTPLNDSIRDVEWRLFRQFYFAEKQKLQYKRMNFYANHTADSLSNYYGGCNACFGNPSFHPVTSQMLILAPTPQPNPISSFYDLSQPCGYATFGNYGGVTKRFYDPANTGLNTGSVAQQVYQTTGQCPMAFQLQNFLSSMALSGNLTASSPVNLNTVNEFNIDLYNTVSGGTMPSSFVNYQWQVTSSAGSVFTAEIVDPATSTSHCTVTLDRTGTSIPAFANIISISPVSYDPTGVGPGAFKATVLYTSGSSTLTATIKGNSCIDVKNCSFAPQCTGNQFAVELFNLYSYITASGLLTSTTAVPISSDTTRIKFLTPVVKNTLGTPNSSVEYKFVAPNKLTLYDSSNPNTKIVLTATISPGGIGASIKYFANVRSNYNNLFIADAMNASNVKIGELRGKAERITPTQTVGISMGDCGLPEPPECDQKEHKVRKDLELLVNEILTTKPFDTNVDLYSLASFSSLLKSYQPINSVSTSGTYTSGITSAPSFDTLQINLSTTDTIALCSFKLFHYRNNSTTLNFPAIKQVSGLTGIGAPDIAGNYRYFRALATYTTVSGDVTDTIYGVSCWPIKNCTVCEPVVVNEGSPLTRGARIEPNLKAYKTYKQSILALNAKEGWNPDSKEYVAPVSYQTYVSKAFIKSDQYVKFVSHFNKLVDDKAMLDPETFINSYGNRVNCTKEYERYAKAVSVHNQQARSSSAIVALGDQAFYVNGLCDNAYQYIDYLLSGRSKKETPQDIKSFLKSTESNQEKNAQGKLLYEKYVKAHRDFVTDKEVQEKVKDVTNTYPLYSYSEAGKANLISSPKGLAKFDSYIKTLEEKRLPPPAFPVFSQEQGSSLTQGQLDSCEANFVSFLTAINNFNAGTYAAAHSFSLDPGIYPNFGSFVEAGYCFCVPVYISYLQSYLIDPINMSRPLPLDIDHFDECPHPVTDTCRLKYTAYQQAVTSYNNYVLDHQDLDYPEISIIYADSTFGQYCICVPKYIAIINGILNGTVPTAEQLDMIQDLALACEKPCAQTPDSAFSFPPFTHYDNPCVRQKINLAMQNGANAYNQYKDSMTTAFADKYTRHCLSAFEKFNYKYVDKEYHYTLYYYDQAGNLIKTIPPAGVEFIPVTSSSDALEQKIISDRTYNQHTVFTNHRMPTIYVYNSLNQLISQSMPDHDVMDICNGTNPNGLDTGLVILSLQFVTPTRGYLCGVARNSSAVRRGYLYTSNDGGNYWTKLNGVTSGDMQKVQFTSATDGYAVSTFGMVFKTIDGGNTWDLLTGLYKPLSGSRYIDHLTDLYFTSGLGLVGGNMQGAVSPVFYTSNGGITFSPATVTGAVAGDTITGFTYDGTTYIASARNGNSGKLFTSTTGTSWTMISNYAANNLKKVQYLNNNLAYAIGEEGTLLKLAQPITAGNPLPKWQLVPTGVLGNIRDMYFKNATEGVAIIDSIPTKGKICKTFNGGLSWEDLSDGGDYYNSLKAYDTIQHRLIAAGNDGLLAKVLMSSFPFGMTKLVNPSVSDNSFADAFVYAGDGSLRAIQVSDVSPDIQISNDAQVNGAVWQAYNTTTAIPPIPSGDAKFKKVLMLDSVPANPYLKGILLATNGSLYSFYHAPNIPYVVCHPVNVSGGFSGKFFTDLTSNGHTFTTPVYALDSTNKNVYRLDFSGTVANATLLNNASSITKRLVSLDINNSSNQLMMVGDSGHIEYTANITANPVVWSDVTLNTLPVAITKVRSISSGNFIAGGIDGALWKSNGGSSTWQLKRSGTIETLTSIAVDNTGAGLVAATHGNLYQLTNAQTQAPVLMPLSTSMLADLTDVAIQPSGITAYATAKDGQVLFMPDYHASLVAYAATATSLPANGVCFKSGPNAMVVGNNVFMANYYSTSAFVTNQIFTGTLRTIHFYDNNNGLVIDSAHVIRKTVDGGQTWSVVIPTVGSPSLSKAYASATNKGILLGMNNYAAVINNNVVTQLAVPGIPVNTNLFDVDFNSTRTFGVIVGARTHAAKIVPSGSSYVITYLGQATTVAQTNFRAVHVFNNNTFIAAGTRGCIYYYKGGSFTQQMAYVAPAGQPQSSIMLRDIYFQDNYNGYVVGTGGAAYKVNLDDTIGTVGTSANMLPWTPFCSDAVNIGYTTNSQIRKLDISAIAFANQSQVMIAGADSNITIGGYAPNRYARLLKEQSGRYSTLFWYDKLGRMVLSQNTKQLNKKNPANALIRNAYSYTLYDALGRITEVGEKYENHTGTAKFADIFGSDVNGYYNNYVLDDAKYLSWLNGSGSRREVTKTYYDVQSVFPTSYYIQENLRKRVASCTFEDVYDGSDLTYNHGTHYTYDIHGNVKSLWQENTQVGVAGEEIKQTDYEYDLISGKVNRVIYSPDYADQFIHRYSYDADNRITKVETSSNGLHYDIDAKYFYYAHGPLARAEYGKDHVQGLDYAYTLQGWIKGVNGNSLKQNRDMGRDGDNSFTNPNGNFARDVMGYTLNYYQGDYEAVNFVKWNTPASRFEAYTNNSDLFNSRNDLYNGNISAMVTTITKPELGGTSGNGADPTILPLGSGYRYDQLNRIAQSTAFTNIDTISANNNWELGSATIPALYRNTFTYDAMGNIGTQVKYDSVGVMMDSLVYHYETEAVSGKMRRNRLYHVNDLVSYIPNYGDIVDQGGFTSAPNLINVSNNYGYDEIGNLIRDSREQIDTIRWNVYGKVRAIIRSPGSMRDNMFFDYDAGGNRIAKHLYTSAGVWKHSLYYQRDAQGNVMAVYDKKTVSSTMSYKLDEQHLYGSSRLGLVHPNLEIIGALAPGDTRKSYLGLKHYEFSNHLGNVLSVVTDKKIQIADVSNHTLVDHYVTDQYYTADYYPFGQILPGRSFATPECEMQPVPDSVKVMVFNEDFNYGPANWTLVDNLNDGHVWYYYSNDPTYIVGDSLQLSNASNPSAYIAYPYPYSTTETTYYYEFDFYEGDCTGLDSAVIAANGLSGEIHIPITGSGHYAGSYTTAASSDGYMGIVLYGNTPCNAYLDNFKQYYYKDTTTYVCSPCVTTSTLLTDGSSLGDWVAQGNTTVATTNVGGVPYVNIALNGGDFDATYPVNFTNGVTYTISMDINMGDCAGKPIFVYVEDYNAGIAGNTYTASGTYTFACTATYTGPGYIEFSPVGIPTCTNFNIGAIRISSQTCSAALVNNYRYGFNGQEKDNEVNGTANAYTAMFWEYDPRLGRRWNLDPVPQGSISDYAVFANNPILHTDVNGDVVDGDKKGKEDYKTYRGKVNEKIDKVKLKIKSLEAKIADSGSSKSLERKMQKQQNRLDTYQTVNKELDALEKSKTVYWLNSSYTGRTSSEGIRGEGYTSYDYSNERVTINYQEGNIGNLTHELKHGYQYEIGQLAFVLQGNLTRPLLYDITDEHAAYKRANDMGYVQSMPDGAYPTIRDRTTQIDIQSAEGIQLRTTNQYHGATGVKPTFRYKGWEDDYNQGINSKNKENK